MQVHWVHILKFIAHLLVCELSHLSVSACVSFLSLSVSPLSLALSVSAPLSVFLSLSFLFVSLCLCVSLCLSVSLCISVFVSLGSLLSVFSLFSLSLCVSQSQSLSISLQTVEFLPNIFGRKLKRSLFYLHKLTAN